jgi:RND family efflux transporter MFP subunit
MKKIKKQFIILAGAVLVMGGFAASCSKTGKETPAESPVNVKTWVASNVSGNGQREYVGTVESENSVDLSFQINGNVEQIYVQEGQNIQKGQLVARINPVTLQNVYASAKATLARAKDAFDRLSVLHKANSLPEIKFIEAQTNLEQAQANERIAKKNLSDCNLYAPHAGVVGKRYAEPGANVMPGSPIVSLMNIATVKIKVPVPENDIALVKLQANCTVKISALGNSEYQGRIIEKGVVADPVSHTYDVKVKVDNAGKQIMPGMVCKAYLPSMDKSNGIVIPLKAVQVASSGQNFIWTMDKSGKATTKEVVTGKLVGNGVLIQSGLKEGDVVIIEGYQNLSLGISVKAI